MESASNASGSQLNNWIKIETGKIRITRVTDFGAHFRMKYYFLLFKHLLRLDVLSDAYSLDMHIREVTTARLQY